MQVCSGLVFVALSTLSIPAAPVLPARNHFLRREARHNRLDTTDTRSFVEEPHIIIEASLLWSQSEVWSLWERVINERYKDLKHVMWASSQHPFVCIGNAQSLLKDVVRCRDSLMHHEGGQGAPKYWVNQAQVYRAWKWHN